MFPRKLDTRWRTSRLEKSPLTDVSPPDLHLLSTCVFIYIHVQSASFVISLCGLLFSLRVDLVSLALLANLHMQGLLWQNHIRISLQMRHIAAAQSRFCFVFIVGAVAYLGGWCAILFRGFCCLVVFTGSVLCQGCWFSFGHRGQAVCHNMSLKNLITLLFISNQLIWDFSKNWSEI